MWRMPERLDHVHRSPACNRTKADRQPDTIRIERPEMPLWLTRWDSSRSQPRRESDGAVMMDKKTAVTRRNFLKGTGLLVVGFSTTGMLPIEVLARAAQGNPVRDYPKFPLDAVDSFIEVHGDGSILVKIGKINN